MNKVIPVLSFFCLLGRILANIVDPYYMHAILSPLSANEDIHTRSERKLSVRGSLLESSVPVTASRTLVPIIAPASSLSFAPAAETQVARATSLALGTSSSTVSNGASVPVASVGPVTAKVVQFKLSYPEYAYGYSVQDFTTGDNKVVKEVREGAIVKGSYSVADPDGMKRTVNYYADPIHGFNAAVHKTQIFK